MPDTYAELITMAAEMRLTAEGLADADAVTQSEYVRGMVMAYRLAAHALGARARTIRTNTPIPGQTVLFEVAP